MVAFSKSILNSILVPVLYGSLDACGGVDFVVVSGDDLFRGAFYRKLKKTLNTLYKVVFMVTKIQSANKFQ